MDGLQSEENGAYETSDTYQYCGTGMHRSGDGLCPMIVHGADDGGLYRCGAVCVSAGFSTLGWAGHGKSRAYPNARSRLNIFMYRSKW